jgi:RimJ/RimL family protein N-acetyltransferase
VSGESEPHPDFGLPVGPKVDANPAARPGPVTLQGHFGHVERLSSAHAGPLWEAVRGHDAIWTYMSAYGPFADAKQFADWVESRIPLEDPYSYAIVDAAGRAVGIATLMEIRPAMRVVEVGHIVYSPALQRVPLGTEAQFLLMRYAFDTLRYRRYEWKCNALNAPSRAAALRYGFQFEGLLRQHMIAKGRNRDTAWYSILDREWPCVRDALEAWLAPENFDEQGRQKRRLEDIRKAIKA